MGRRGSDALDTACIVAVEDRCVLGLGNPGGGIDQRLEVGILRSSLDAVQFLAGQLEVRAQLYERQHLTTRGLDLGSGGASERIPASRVHGSCGGAERPLE